MCLTLNSATEWAASMFHVVVEVWVGAKVVFVTVIVPLSELKIFIDIGHIDIDISNGQL